MRRGCETALGALAVVWLLAGCGGPAPREAELNLLLVTLDTLRADHVSVYGDAGAETHISTPWQSPACASNGRWRWHL